MTTSLSPTRLKKQASTIPNENLKNFPEIPSFQAIPLEQHSTNLASIFGIDTLQSKTWPKICVKKLSLSIYANFSFY